MTSPVRVLLVDDSATIRAMLSALLGDLPEIELVGVAEHGEAAIAVALEVRPDVIVMDMQMPGIGGLEAAQSILAHWPEAKIIMNTAYADAEFQAQAAAIGAAGYATKDQRPAALIETVLEVAGQRGDPMPDSDPAPSAGGAAPTFDSEVLGEMLELMDGDVEIVDDIAATWADDAPNHVAAITGDGDLGDIHHAAHTLKSSSRSVGAMQLGDLAERIEDAARDGNAAAVAELVSSVQPAFEAARTALADWRRLLA